MPETRKSKARRISSCLKETGTALIPFATALLIALSSVCFAAEPVIIDETLRIKDICTNIEYLLDETNSLTIEDFRKSTDRNAFTWKKLNSHDLRLGFVRAAVWVRFTARNTSPRDIEWLLQQDHFSMTRLALYVLEDRNLVRSVETGNMFRFDDRPFDDPTFVFPITLRAGSVNEYYMRFINKFPMSINLRAASLASFYRERDKMLPLLWILYGFFIVMIVYNFILFFSMSIRDRSYFYYTLFMITFLAYMMHYNGHAAQYLWGNFPLWTSNMGYFFISLMAATVIQFVRHFISFWELNKRIDITIKITVIVNAAISVLSLFLNRYVWFGVLLVAIVILSLTYGFMVLIYSAIIKNSRQAKIYLLSSVLLFIAAMVFALRALDIIPGTFLSSNGLLMGGAFQVIILSFGLADKFNIMRRDIRKAEIKYRHIIESSTEIIFLLDRSLNIVSINNAVEKHLGHPAKYFIGKNFLDLIQDTWSERTQITRQLVEEQIAEFFEKKTGVQFRTTFQPLFKIEPEDFIVKFEYIETDDVGYKVLGKASPVTDDMLLRFLVVEHFIYTMDNYLNNADLMSLRLTRNLVRYFPNHEIPLIRVAIREILVNAIEHGNLGISFDEKTTALEKGNYFEIIHERQKESTLNDRKLIIDYTLDEKKVVYRISDEGLGFDHREIMALDPASENEKLLTHGRGLFMARNTFDSIEFNDRGNTVILTKYF
jgi:two-component system, sensor histidine kinase LadS